MTYRIIEYKTYDEEAATSMKFTDYAEKSKVERGKLGIMTSPEYDDRGDFDKKAYLWKEEGGVLVNDYNQGYMIYHNYVGDNTDPVDAEEI